MKFFYLLIILLSCSTPLFNKTKVVELGDESDNSFDEETHNFELHDKNDEFYLNEKSKSHDHNHDSLASTPNILPALQAQLLWIGFNFQPEKGWAHVELKTKGSPKFEIFEEDISSEEKNLVIRFLETSIHSQKLSKPLDVRNFFSPITYIKTRKRKDSPKDLEILITMKKATFKPKMFSKNDKWLFSFPMLEIQQENMDREAEKVQDLSIKNLDILKGSKLPENMVSPLKTLPSNSSDDFEELLSFHHGIQKIRSVGSLDLDEEENFHERRPPQEKTSASLFPFQEHEGKRQPKEPSRPSSLAKVSMEFKGASLREVIRALSQENGVNFIIPEDVGHKKVYLTLKEIPWDEALEAVLETHSLGMTELKGGIIRIDTLAGLEVEKRDMEKVRKSQQLLIPTKVLVARLSYAKASDVSKIVTSMLSSASWDSRVKVEADERTNAIVVEAIPEELAKIEELIERIDFQTPQVKIETRVVEILKKVDNFLGISWGGPLRVDQGRGLGFGNLAFPHSLQSAFSVDTGARDRDNGGRFDTYFGSINNALELDLRLRMSELSNYTRSLQNNSVIVLNNEEAKLEAGQEDFFSIPTGNGQTALASVKFTLDIKVKPHITADGSIQMAISVSNAAPSDAKNQVASSRSLRTLKTNMLRKNGETAVIGGLYTTQMRESYQGVPFLGKIPILGLLFRSRGMIEDRRELIIMVTPTVVNTVKKQPRVEKTKALKQVAEEDKNDENIHGEEDWGLEETFDNKDKLHEEKDTKDKNENNQQESDLFSELEAIEPDKESKTNVVSVKESSGEIQKTMDDEDFDF